MSRAKTLRVIWYIFQAQSGMQMRRLAIHLLYSCTERFVVIVTLSKHEFRKLLAIAAVLPQGHWAPMSWKLQNEGGIALNMLARYSSHISFFHNQECVYIPRIWSKVGAVVSNFVYRKPRSRGSQWVWNLYTPSSLWSDEVKRVGDGECKIIRAVDSYNNKMVE